jgi:protease I
MATILMPVPAQDFDPTETAVPWKILAACGHQVVFATPDGRPGTADPRVLTGKGFGPLAAVLRADANGRAAYAEMAASPAFQAPLRWADLQGADFQALLLPGGHAPGMRPYIESPGLQSLVAGFFAQDKPVGAICHGVLLAARSHRADGKSVLHGRRTTALLKSMEMSAWALTMAWLGDYYRTYPQTVEDEVLACLADPVDFLSGSTGLLRDSPERLQRGFVVHDRNYVSARWPGDAHRFAMEFATTLG